MARILKNFRRLVATCAVLVAAAPAWAAPTVEQMLAFQPKFTDVQISTPTKEEYAYCQVKLVTGSAQGSSGWLLVDGKGKSLRRFFDSNGDKKIDMWSYYKDGLEVYREIDSNFNEKPDQFRWLNSAGMKWGISTQENGKIDAWQMISAEELGQEVFAALATNDFAGLQALFVTEAEMRALKLPAGEAQRMVALQKNASAKFQATRGKLPQLDAKAKFVRVESAAPNCKPADSIPTDHDMLYFPTRTILFETGDKKHDWVLTGELVKVGMAWRLVDGPGLSDVPPDPLPQNNNVAMQKLLDELNALDKAAPPPLQNPGSDPKVQVYNVTRVGIIQKILEHVKGEDADNWQKQIFDNLSAAYQAGHDDSLKFIGMRRDQIAKATPNSELVAYGTYRELWASFAYKLFKEGQKHQDAWIDALIKYAQTYPKSEDTPEALNMVAQHCEFAGKDEESKRYYQQIYKTFPNHLLAAKAKGSETRLSLIGRKMELVGPQLGTGAMFNINSLKGKVVVVYYWASNVTVCRNDFETLKRLRTAHAKDLELVCISLDDTEQKAAAYLQPLQVPAAHLFQAAPNGNGLDSPLSTFYGINGLPHLFLINRDGNVINRTLQVGDLENELKKAL